MDMKDYIAQAKVILSQVHVQAMPPEILQIEALLNTDNPNASEVAHLLASNPELLGEFLSLANRVLNRPDDSLIQDAGSAVHLLGLDEIHYLFLSSYLIKNLPVSETDRKVVLHSMRYDPENYAEVYFSNQLDHPLSAYQDELAHYQTAHTFVGGIVAKRWNLGNLLYRSILFHHHSDLEEVSSYDKRAAQMVAANRVANYLVFKVFSDHFITHELEAYYEEACQFLKLPDNAVRAAISAIEKWGSGSGFHASSH